jgi:hypothetical protein
MINKAYVPVEVHSPRRLPLWKLPAQRIPLGIANDYKPSVAQMPDGELVMVGLYSETRQDGSYREWTPIWRSLDGGLTWSKRRVLTDVIGREQWLTITSDGTMFMSCHLLINDVNNTDGIGHSYLHRSIDSGQTWERTKIHLTSEDIPGIPAGGTTLTSRNVVELPDGTLQFGVSVCNTAIAHFWTSRDHGRTWDPGEQVAIGDYRNEPYDNGDGFFGEDFTFRTQSGKLLHWIRCGPPSPMYPKRDGRLVPFRDDSGDRSMLCESNDGGRTWENFRDFGDYGAMYVRVIQLDDDRLLATYTRRSLFEPLGLRAVFSYDDGDTWDFEDDTLVIEGKTPWGQGQGGGFGNTLKLERNNLLSAYTYRGEEGQTHLEVVRWQLPIREERPYFIDADILELKDPDRLVTLHDWTGAGGSEILLYDSSQRTCGTPQSAVTTETTTLNGETFDARIEFFAGDEIGDPCTGFSFMHLPVTDWSGFVSVAMRVHNPTEKPQEIALWLWDGEESGPHRNHAIAPNQTSTLFMTSDEIRQEINESHIPMVVLLSFERERAQELLVGPLFLVRA